MATPTIEAIDVQEIRINSDYDLEIGITGDPLEVTVAGLFEGFYYSWNAANDTLTIAGEATRLLGDAIWVVSAKETSSSTAVIREIRYNVVSGAPLIDNIGVITVYKGVESNVFVGIQNKPTQIRSDGLLLGLKSDIEAIPSEDEDVDPIEGVRIIGMIPSDVDLTVVDDEINIFTSNDGGEDNYNTLITIGSGTPPPMSEVNFERDEEGINFMWTAVAGALSYAYRIGADGDWIDVGNVLESIVTGFTEVSPIVYWRVNSAWVGSPLSVIIATDIYLFSDNIDNLFRMNGDDGTLLWTYQGVLGSYIRSRIVTDSNENAILLNDTNADIYKISSDGTLLWTNTDLPIRLNGYNDLVIDSDDNIYAFGLFSGSSINKISSGGTLLWTTDTPDTSVQAIVFDSDNNIHTIFSSEIRKYSSGGTLLWSIVVSSEDRSFSSLTIDSDGNIYAAEDPRGELHKISPDGILLWSNAEAVSGIGPRTVHPLLIADDGSIYLFSFTTSVNRIYKFNNSGIFLWSYQPSHSSSSRFGDLMLDSEGNLIILDHVNDTVIKINPSGNLLWTYNPSDSSAIRLDNDDNVYLLWTSNDSAQFATHFLRKIDGATGDVLWTYILPSSSYEVEFLVDSDNQVYILQDNSGLVTKVSSSGVLLWVMSPGSGGNYREMVFSR